MYTLEVKYNDAWRELQMYSFDPLPYNILTNKIGEPSSRKISHSNTLSLPICGTNKRSLGLNIHNYADMRQALNRKYECVMKENGKTIRRGYLVINKVTTKDIKVNVIDEGLDLLDKWGENKLQDIYNNEDLVSNMPTDYQYIINEAQTLLMDSTLPVQDLIAMPSEGWPLIAWPNTLNAIGSKFNKLENGSRVPSDRLNPFQSRPLYNALGILKSVCYAYGYEPEFQDINTDELSKLFIVGSGMGDDKESGGLSTRNPVYNGSMYEQSGWVSPADTTYWQHVVKGSTADFIRPDDLTGYTPPPNIVFSSYESQYCIMKVNIDDSYEGNINCKLHWNWLGLNVTSRVYINAVYYNTAGDGVVHKELTTDPDFTVPDNELAEAEFKIDKSELTTPPAGGADLVGIQIWVLQQQDGQNLNNSSADVDYITEEYTTNTNVAIDEYQQYAIDTTVNITKSGPTQTVKQLVSAILAQQGILIDIRARKKKVVFFTYSTYKRKQENKKYSDWSKYFIETLGIEYSTNFGKNFGKNNRVSLQDPYGGNWSEITLANIENGSKFIDFVNSPTKDLKDVSGVSLINIGGTHPYFEYTNTGLGLVYSDNQITGLTQTTADGTEQSGLDAWQIQNVNYLSLPGGVFDWYSAVSNGVKKKAYFLLPKYVVNDIDLTLPIYIDKLGGYHIIEQISEYRDGQNVVEVDLIKTEITEKYVPETPIIGEPPTVSVTLPLNNSDYVGGESVYFNADAQDPDGTIVKVEYYVDDIYIGYSVTGPDYVFSKSDLEIGSHSVIAKAYDNDGNVSSSSQIVFNVLDPLTVPQERTLSNGITVIYDPNANKYYIDGTLNNNDTVYANLSSFITPPSESKYESGNAKDGNWYYDYSGHIVFDGGVPIGTTYNMVELTNYSAPAAPDPTIVIPLAQGPNFIYDPNSVKYYIDGTVTDDTSSMYYNLYDDGVPPIDPIYSSWSTPNGEPISGQVGIFYMWWPNPTQGYIGRTSGLVIGQNFNMVELLLVP